MVPAAGAKALRVNSQHLLHMLLLAMASMAYMWFISSS